MSPLDKLLQVEVYKAISEIPDELFRVLVEDLTYWKRGWLMRPTAEALRAAAAPNPAAVGFIDGKPVGWVLVDEVKPSCRVQMFVAEHCRRNGIAAQLVRNLQYFLGQQIYLEGYEIGVSVLQKVRRSLNP